MPKAKIDKTYNITNELCSYCSNSIAKFKFMNGKFCCAESYNSCPKIKTSNSNGLKESYKNGGRPPASEAYENLPEESKNRMAWSRGLNFVINREHIIKTKGYKCEICDLNEWQGKDITLELDHIDGNNQNNIVENLRLLCPNCHSQTNNWRGRNINSGVDKISDDDLIKNLKLTKNIRQALMASGLAAKGGNYSRAKKLLNSIYESTDDYSSFLYIWVNNGNRNVCINISELSDFQKLNWSVGIHIK